MNKYARPDTQCTKQRSTIGKLVVANETYQRKMAKLNGDNLKQISNFELESTGLYRSEK